MSDDDHLDDEQRAAVEAAEPAIAVLAGPGSGKTRVLSFRARHLLRADAKSRALLLTFTNKAAAEMKARARGVAAVASRRLKACNFHTFGSELLRAHGELLGIEPTFDILDEPEAAELRSEFASGPYASLAWSWSRSRLRREDPPERVREFGDQYEAAKRQAGVVDFDDLVVYAARLLSEHPELASAYATRFAHVLVDEFQDTNAAQFAIVQALVPKSRTVSIFADDDQAIYGFAGADLAHIRRFVEQLDAKEYHLTTNYRCRSAVVERANRLLDADPSASARRMKAAHAGGEVVAVPFRTTEDEAAWVAEAVEGAVSDGVTPEEVSVLARTRNRAAQTLEELRGRGVPVSDWLGDRYPTRERRILRTCLAVVRPRLSRRQVRSLCELYGLPDSEELDTATFFERNADKPGIAALAQVARLPGDGGSVAAILEAVQASLEGIDVDLATSLQIVADSVQAFEEHDSEFTFDHLLSELALGGTGGAPTEGGGVKVATLHRTKGLQWPHVYLLGLEDDHLPSYQCKTDEDIAAERRVCFVGVCRAECRLVLTHVAQNRGYIKRPSRFLDEMGL